MIALLHFLLVAAAFLGVFLTGYVLGEQTDAAAHLTEDDFSSLKGFTASDWNDHETSGLQKDSSEDSEASRRQ